MPIRPMAEPTMTTIVRRGMRLVPVLVILLSLSTSCSAFIEGIYCGRDNCYDVLELSRSASRQEVVKSYRRLAKIHHPDVVRGDSGVKEDAATRFRLIASAYEVLKDEESRKEYDYMLDNPEEVYRHYYNYYRRQYAPKVDIRIVLIVTITVVSAFQYYGARSRHREAIDYLLTVPKYRMRANEIARTQGLLLSEKEAKKRNRGKSKEEVKEEEESVLRSIIQDKMDITGGYSPPSFKDVLWVQLILLPHTIAVWIIFYVRWFVLFTCLGQELGLPEKEYLIRRYMGYSAAQWQGLEEEEKEEYLEQELWLWENFKPWKQEKDEETKARLAESASYKRYRRWMKKGGAGQITFMED